MFHKLLNSCKNFKKEYFRDKESKLFLGIEVIELVLATLSLYLATVKDAYFSIDVTIETIVFVSSIIISYALFIHKTHEDLMSLFRCSFALGLLGIIGVTGFMWPTLAVVFTVLAAILIVTCCIISKSSKKEDDKDE